ncbi:MAG: molybdopterin molybdotransferase MoeA [Bacteroidetes bacterium]|nr:molybdopterin molybdotransferase MoeA [Bacteroidota bacterium]
MKKIDMMDHHQAEKIILSQNKLLNNDTELVSLTDALGRYLVEPVLSIVDSPPFNKSAMDGFAVAAGDNLVGTRLIIQETVAAGDVPKLSIRKGYATRIMTGAMIPEDSERVIRVEFTTESNGIVVIVKPEMQNASNIILQGENTQTGSVILDKKRLNSRDAGILAASGIGSVTVYRKLKVATVTTGSELAEPGTGLKPGYIYNSNSYQLGAQLQEMGCEHIPLGIIPDTLEAHEEYLGRGLEEADILIVTGGVSMGDFDYVPETLRKLGTEVLIHGLRIKPGKPLLFGRKDDTLVFGMPGNPVSSYVLFEVLVKPLIYVLNGLEYAPISISGELTDQVGRHDIERHEFRPARIRRVKGMIMVEPLTYHGSSHLNGLRYADGLFQIPTGIKTLDKGAIVDVRLF